MHYLLEQKNKLILLQNGFKHVTCIICYNIQSNWNKLKLNHQVPTHELIYIKTDQIKLQSTIYMCKLHNWQG